MDIKDHNVQNCKIENCSVSTGIHEGLTFGGGRLTFSGFWEQPCHFHARKHESESPQDGECWPFKDQDLSEVKDAIKALLDTEIF